MANILHLKCSHEGCSQFFDHPSAAESVAGVVAIDGTWLESAEPGGILLQEPPAAGSEHRVSLRGPLRVDLDGDLFIYYEDPLSALNGLDTQEGIDAARFCRCSTLRRDSDEELIVRVDDTLTFDDCQRQFAETALPSNWTSFLSSNLDELDVLAFPHHDLLNINIQSDLGMRLVIKKDSELATIVMVNDWDFHRNVIYGTSISVDAKQYAQSGLRAFL